MGGKNEWWGLVNRYGGSSCIRQRVRSELKVGYGKCWFWYGCSETNAVSSLFSSLFFSVLCHGVSRTANGDFCINSKWILATYFSVATRCQDRVLPTGLSVRTVQRDLFAHKISAILSRFSKDFYKQMALRIFPKTTFDLFLQLKKGISFGWNLIALSKNYSENFVSTLSSIRTSCHTIFYFSFLLPWP